MNWTQAKTDFSTYLKIERGLSDNTINSYLLDVEKLIVFLKENNSGDSPLNVCISNCKTA